MRRTRNDQLEALWQSGMQALMQPLHVHGYNSSVKKKWKSL